MDAEEEPADKRESGNAVGTKLKSLMGDMAQNVTTIECLIASMTTEQDRRHVNEKMKETAVQLNELLPLMQTYLGLPEPVAPNEKEEWWMQREKLNREFEVFLHNFRVLNAVLGSKLATIPNESLAEILRSELQSAETDNVGQHDESSLAEIVAEAEQSLIVTVNAVNDGQSSSVTAKAQAGVDERKGISQEECANEEQRLCQDGQSSSSSPAKVGKSKERRVSMPCRQS